MEWRAFRCLLGTVALLAVAACGQAPSAGSKSPDPYEPIAEAAPSDAPATSATSGETRLAIVFGVSDYNADGDILDLDADATLATGAATDLANARADAQDVARLLSSIGFDVRTKLDANRDETISAMIEFGADANRARSRGDVTTFVFYAGHAIQVDGANFLIPSNARLPAQDLSSLPARQAQTLLETRAVSLATLMEQLPPDPGSGVNIVVLDACRNNPWDRRLRGLSRGAGVRGLADERFNVRRTIIAYSAQPGATASDGYSGNSPFTAALKDWITRPDLSVKDMFDEVGAAVERQSAGQVPWTNAPSLGRYCLAGCESKSAPTGQDAPQVSGGDYGPFGIDRLHPLVRRAVLESRVAQREARSAAARAEDAERRGLAAAGRARANASGTRATTYSKGDRYEGEYSAGNRNGFGVYRWPDGDQYAGQHANGKHQGYGVYRDGDPVYGGSVYMGRFMSGKRDGYGVRTRPSGYRYEGQFAAGFANGYGRDVQPSGDDIFEGEVRSAPSQKKAGVYDIMLQGYGVRWNRRGDVVEAGRFENNRLVESLPGPQPPAAAPVTAAP